MTGPGEVEEPGWRVRFGVGLLADCPMGEAQRLAHEREDERERKAAEFEAEQRRTAALERRAQLQMRGVEARSHADILAAASRGMDSTDRIEARREREAAELLGRPAPRFDKWESKANVAAAEAEREGTPASQADLRELEGQVTGLKSAIHALKRKRR